jgi:hypothetical protein
MWGNLWREWRIRYESWGQWGILGIECALLALSVFWASGRALPQLHVRGGSVLDIVWAIGHANTALQPASLGLALVIALWAWWHTLMSARTLGNMPAARIADAAQGYTRLAGRGRLLEGRQRVFEPGTGLPCLWYRVSYRNGHKSDLWASSTFDESDASFVLDDGSGAVCAVDPEGATMLVRRHKVEYEEDGANLEYWYLLPGDQIYVLGQFTTVGNINPDLETHRQIGELLELWKAERAQLLRRFDLDGDGQLSQQEWELARAAARREVERNQREALGAAQAHVMRKPNDGRPYLISDRDPAALARRFRFWAIAHGAVFIAAIAALTQLHVRVS